MNISFLNPNFLFLLLLVPVLWFFPKRVERVAHGVIRSLLVGCIIVALAQPVFVSSRTEVHQVVIVDHSQSLSEQQHQAANEMLDAVIKETGPRDKLTIITLGSQQKSRSIAATNQQISITSESQSSLSSALAAASQQIPRGAQGVVTLITDGLSTDRRWGPAVQSLQERGIPVNTHDLGIQDGDIFPSSLYVDGPVRVGQTVSAEVVVIGSSEEFQVRLSSPDGELAISPLQQSDGRASVVLEFEANQAGFLQLTAEVVTQSADRDATNNQLSRTIAIQNPLRTLYVGERMQDGVGQWSNLIGQGFDIVDGASQKLDGNFDFSGFDLVVIDDMPARKLDDSFQRNLKKAVVDDGMGLVYAGGEAAFGGGGYDQTPIADVLPIEIKQDNEKKDPSTSLAIIVDSSGSMQGTRIDLAKQIARLAVRKLQSHDRVGIVEFYGAKHWAIPMQPAANKIEIDRAIGRIQAVGGTILLPAIEEAYYGLKNLDTRYKHILVLTDAGIENADYESLLRRISKDGINVSTVLVGPEVHNVIMNDMANWGKGRFYSVADRMNLVELILKQPVDNKMPAYKSGEFVLNSRLGKGWWGEVNRNEIPLLNGYVETRRRPEAEVLLEVENNGHPVISTWRYGLGRVTAMMTEPVGPGTQSWQQWQNYGQMLARVMSRTADDGRAFRYQLERDDYRLMVRAQRYSQDTTLAPNLTTVAADDLPATELEFRQMTPDLYQAEVLIPPTSNVQLQTIQGEHLVSNVLDDYSPETQVDPYSGLDLAELSRVTGGQAMELGSPITLAQMSDQNSDSLSLTKLWPWFILLGIVVYLSELTYRRWPRT